LFEYSADVVISSCCSYYQLQLCVGPRGMVFREDPLTPTPAYI